MTSAIALIPARAGSKRVKDKNIRLLAGHPLLAYSIRAAVDSGVFTKVVVSTDSESYAEVARQYGAEVPFLRPATLAGDKSPDFEWVSHAISWFSARGAHFDAFSILRPTSPFRLPSTIQRAWNQFTSDGQADSLRAVQKCTEHPGKMWVIRGSRMTPILPYLNEAAPWHSSQYPSLPEIYVQNASLEIARVSVLAETATISGHSVIPFITEGYEGTDVNNEVDWWYATHIVDQYSAQLPIIPIGSI